MGKIRHYILRGREIVVIDDLAEWIRIRMACKEEDIQVARTKVGEMDISTVFLPINHNHFNDSDPILFETMVFGGHLDEACIRSRTYDEAEKVHAEVVREAEGIQSQLDKLSLMATMIDLELEREHSS